MSGFDHPPEINRDYIRLLQVMRRFVQQEFSVAIRMTQGDAVERLLHFSALSRNPVLREMGAELREFTTHAPAIAAEGPENGSEKNQRRYRGITVDGTPESPAPASAKPEAAAKRPQRIYRGRAISA